jgi:phage shock protein PspC (stress-responsive transcriptional regulator)
MASQNVRKLYRSKTNKMIAGVCGGLAEYFNIDANLMRVIYILLFFVTGLLPLIIIYLIMWAIVPAR